MISKTYTIRPVRIEIKPSRILDGEVGLFAARNLRRGSVVVDASHFSDLRLVSWKSFNKLDRITQKKIMDYCPGSVKGFLAPPDMNYISIAWHMNHSCNPNVGFNASDDFILIRDVKKGEELRWDYGYDETNPAFKMKCTCGEKECRGKVTGNDWRLLMNDPRKRQFFSRDMKAFLKK